MEYRKRLRLVGGAALVALGAVSLYAAWVLTRRTVFDYVHLGVWGVSTGVVLVGVLLTVTYGGLVALSRGYRSFVAREDDGDAFAEVKRRLTSPPVSRVWLPLVVLGAVAWTALSVAPEWAEAASVFEPLAVAAWVLVPVAVYFDASAREVDDRSKVRERVYVVGSLFPFFAAVVGAIYVTRRAARR